MSNPQKLGVGKESKAGNPPMWWMVQQSGKEYGPHSREEVESMLSSAMLDDTAQIWTEGWPAWRPITSAFSQSRAAAPPSAAAPAVTYATPPASSYQKPRSSTGKYLARVGLRSFIFQVVLTAWTVFYIVWLLVMWITIWAHTSSRPVPVRGYSYSSVSPFSGLDSLAGFTSSVLGFLLIWALVGLPVGIAAVATLENNK